MSTLGGLLVQRHAHGGMLPLRRQQRRPAVRLRVGGGVRRQHKAAVGPELGGAAERYADPGPLKRVSIFQPPVEGGVCPEGCRLRGFVEHAAPADVQRDPALVEHPTSMGDEPSQRNRELAKDARRGRASGPLLVRLVLGLAGPDTQEQSRVEAGTLDLASRTEGAGLLAEWPLQVPNRDEDLFAIRRLQAPHLVAEHGHVCHR
mmetsp:Transcript_125477/g.401832  ORF Transcript_125477/g.401832 Transcript_125477/m.401832 type:complete len:204 (-) Transcript_125477:149-760(-)